MYNQGNINLTYDNGFLVVEYKNSGGNNVTRLKPFHKVDSTSCHDGLVQLENSTVKYVGEVKPSCEGYMKFADNKQEAFKFSEEKKEIVWTGPDARDKWIRG